MPMQPRQHVPLWKQNAKPRVRPTTSQRGYGSYWQKLSAAVRREEPACRKCGKPSSCVDHIIAKAKGGTDARENLQGLCWKCHNRKTNEVDGGGISEDVRSYLK